MTLICLESLIPFLKMLLDRSMSIHILSKLHRNCRDSYEKVLHTIGVQAIKQNISVNQNFYFSNTVTSQRICSFKQ